MFFANDKPTSTKYLFNHDLNYGCLLHMFSLRFSGRKFFEALAIHSSEYHNTMSTKLDHDN